MRVVFMVIRYLLALQFTYAGIEKFMPFDAAHLKNANAGSAEFVKFYLLLHETGYLYFVGFFQLLCGLMLVFRKTHLLGAIMLVPLLLCLIATHVFISKNLSFVVYDTILFLLNTFLIGKEYTNLSKILFSNT